MKLKETLIHRWLSVPYVLHTTVRHSSSKKAPTILFLHGIGNSGEAWKDVIEKLPKEYRIITIDLLGFGKSPKPSWDTYDAKRQARSVLATYLSLRMHGRVILVGHSLGALVAVEMAKLYPIVVHSLILCSPPFYRIDETKRRHMLRADSMIREMYRIAKNRPDQFVRLGLLAAKLGLVNDSFSLTKDNVPAYFSALESCIINQTSLEDAEKLTMPTHIIHGRLDPVVISKNLRHLKKQNSLITIETIIASHEVKGVFIDKVASSIDDAVVAIDGAAPITRP